MNDYRILVVDDEEDLCEILKFNLEMEGYMVDTANSAEEALKLELPRYNLILLDVMMGEISGFKMASMMKKNKDTQNIPIIFITAKDTENDTLTGFNLGADDYISKPFMPQELLLRVYAVLRRTYKEDSPRVFLDGCTIDFSRAEVHKGSEIISLTAKEHTLLETLARNAGKIVTVDALCEALWGDNPFGYENSLNAHVRRVREKIETDPSKPVSLITIKGLGYKLIARK
mgnify:CR=1 FL=1